MPRVSICIPSYNHQKYVGEAIQSVLDQTYGDFEIVITDDGSSDGTVREIKKFTDPRIKLFCFEQNQGSAIAMTQCLNEAQGEYIGILNSDDAFLPTKLEKQVRFLDEHPEIMAVFSHARIIDDDGTPFKDSDHFYYSIFLQLNRTRFAWLNRFFFRGNCLCHPSILARRACYMEIHPPDPRQVQLGDFRRWVRVCLRHEIYVLEEELIKFRVRAGNANISADKPETIIRCAWEMGHILKDYLTITSIEDFTRIFPDFSIEKGHLDANLIPFYVAKLALTVNHPAYHYFALETFHNLLRNPDKARLLWESHGFSYRHFQRLTGQYDVFSLTKKAITRGLIRRLHSKLKKDLKRVLWRFGLK